MKKIRIITDCTMTVLSLLLMAFQITGQFAHEWIGTAMFVFFIIHNILNIKWYRNVTKGKYTLYRIMMSAINILVLFSMIGLMISGIILSHYVFGFLDIEFSISFARKLHFFTSYWEFVLMSLHIGLHWNMIIVNLGKISKFKTIALKVFAVLIAVYGVYGLIKHDIVRNLLLLNDYAYFNYEQSAISYFAEYIAIMGLFVFIAYYIAKTLRLCKK
ncbi:MAG: DUF4405 domain-containing protein [Lachnospirales bacterium]